LHLRSIGADFGHQLLNQRGIVAQVLLAAAPLFLAGISQVFEHPDGQLPGGEALLRTRLEKVDDSLPEVQFAGHVKA